MIRLFTVHYRVSENIRLFTVHYRVTENIRLFTVYCRVTENIRLFTVYCRVTEHIRLFTVYSTVYMAGLQKKSDYLLYTLQCKWQGHYIENIRLCTGQCSTVHLLFTNGLK